MTVNLATFYYVTRKYCGSLKMKCLVSGSKTLMLTHLLKQPNHLAWFNKFFELFYHD